MSREFRDVAAALQADLDQREARLGELLGLDRGVPLDVVFLVSPDVGMRLTRDGVTPPNVRISWLLDPGSMYAMDPNLGQPRPSTLSSETVPDEGT